MPCRSILLACTFSALLLWGSAALPQEAPHAIGAGPQLLVDDLLISQQHGLVRETHACTKRGTPVMEPEMPWEQEGDDQRVYIYGTVLRDPDSGLLRMWYNRGSDVLYATSEDGIQWARAALGIVAINGSSANNILLRGIHSPSVVYNADAPEAERYVMLGYGKKPERGYYVLHAADGLHWRRYPNNPVLPGGDTCTLMFDAATDTYLAFHKRNVKWRGHERRTVYLSESENRRDWSEARLVMAPDETDDAQVAEEGGLFAQFYNMSVIPYGDQILGFVTNFRYNGAPDRTGPLQSSHDGPIDVQLVHSRDGRAWQRSEDRAPVIPNGPHDYDAGSILGVANSLIDMGDEVWTWYTAITTTHGGFVPEKRITIAVAKWRRDGFVSLNAGAVGGTLRTVPLQFSGERLVVNAVAGELTAAILDAEGQPVPGYAHDDCLPVTGDSVRHVVAWRSHDTLPAERPVRLDFRMENAELYSFSVVDSALAPD